MIGNGNATILAAKIIIPKIPVLILHRSIPYHTEGSATISLQCIVYNAEKQLKTLIHFFVFTILFYAQRILRK